MRKKICRILFLTVLAAGGVRAGVPLRDSLFRTDTATLRAARVIGQGEAPVQVLAGEELQRLNTVSVADAVRYFSGVQIKDYGGIGGLKTVNVRSMGSQHVGVFYDGVQLGNAQNGQIDLGRFSMDNMESVALFNGQRASIFQSARDFQTASSVYLTTRRPTENRLQVSFKAGSFGTWNPAVLLERRLSKRLAAQLSGEWMQTTGRYKFTYAANGWRQTDTRRNGDVQALRVETGLFGRLERGDWTAKIYTYNSERGYPGASVREEPGRFRHEDRQWDRNIFAQTTLRQFWGRWSLLANGKYSNDWLRYLSDPRKDVSAMWVDNRFRQQEGYLSAAGLFQAREWLRTSLAVDGIYNTLSGNLHDFARPRRFTLLTAAAAAADFHAFRAQSSILLTRVRDRVHGEAAPARTEWSPSLTASWKVAPTLTLRTFWKKIFRMPTFNDLYYTFIGDINLRPERTEQLDAGFSWSQKGIELQVDGYFNCVHDKIVAMPTSNQFRWTMLNLGYVEILGVDASLSGRRKVGAFDLTARLSYTHQRARDLTQPADEWHGGQIPYTPWNSGSLTAGAAWYGWTLDYSFIYTGERYSSRANIPENHVQPWYTHDMSVSKTFGRWRTTAQVNNIFNQQYEVVACYPMPGTNWNLKLAVDF